MPEHPHYRREEAKVFRDRVGSSNHDTAGQNFFAVNGRGLGRVPDFTRPRGPILCRSVISERTRIFEFSME